jgi:two-component system sensor histidine kinase DctS
VRAPRGRGFRAGGLAVTDAAPAAPAAGPVAPAPVDTPAGSGPAWLPLAWRRGVLWLALLVLVVVMLGTLVWLAGRYEASEVQSKLERDAADTVADMRAGLARNLQALQILQALQARQGPPERWQESALQLLDERRELLRIEQRDADLGLQRAIDSPFRRPLFEVAPPGQDAHPNLSLACAVARRQGTPAYSASYFVPQPGGLGNEVIDLCVPYLASGRVASYLVATYGLHEVLSVYAARQLARHQEVALTEVDGTRLAALKNDNPRGLRSFTTQNLIDLTGNTMVLRLDSWHRAPSIFPNVLTALVTAMSIALVVVLAMLVKDSRLRMRAERDLGDALAFRKAMEDSLVTGLRARDLQGRITYVNPAFCQMVGFTAEELMGRSQPPYWPPDLAPQYLERQAIRFNGGGLPPRNGHESIFMHRDGRRFPVLVIEAPLISATGRHSGWMGAFIDIGEQRRIEELSRATQERLQATARLATVGEMASLLSHELTQPLAAISSYANGSLNLLAHPAPDGGARPAAGDPADRAAAARAQQDDDIALAMRRIAEQAERAGKVIRSVRDFVRRRDATREAVPPRELLDAVMPLVGLQARKLQVQVLIDLPPRLPSAWCDRTMVEQVLLNLARNGMQAMDRPDASGGAAGRILTLAVREASPDDRGQWLEFSVADTGPGIPEDVAQKLFTPFFTTKAEGMGLGLSLCRSVIEQHGGRLQHLPRPRGGMLFVFTIPVEKAAPAPHDPPPGPPPGATPHAPHPHGTPA